MPIKVPDDLPAVKTLGEENIFVMTQKRAMTQDIRPLRILLLNLMPKKIETETQFARLLGNTPLQIELNLMRIKSHEAKNTSQDHLLSFYKTFDEYKNTNWDGMIITGAPVEHLPFEEVDYWSELCQIMEWSKTHVHSTFHICWGAQAGLYYHYGIQKIKLPKKKFGIFKHIVDYKQSMLLRGFDDNFYVPHSRHTTVDRGQIEKKKDLRILSSIEDGEVNLVFKKGGRQIFAIGHCEYDPLTLDAEYKRDLNFGAPIEMPVNYYKDNDPNREPVVLWRGHANLLFSNWLNYFVYQTTPYELSLLK